MPKVPDDPRPLPPEKPEPGDCCNSGCERCVLVVYEEAMEAYREALLEWERRRAHGKADLGLPNGTVQSVALAVAS